MKLIADCKPQWRSVPVMIDFRFGLLIIAIITVAGYSLRAQSPPAFDPVSLKKLSVEELLDVEVALVNRTPQRLSSAGSAVQVITGEDIRRSGATNIPEALRMVTNLQVAQLRSNAWSISARGFNNRYANKLLVMIDGRTVYTPLFGGVLWDLQNLLLEDVEKVEVVSGPGGSLWGANAINGVINIVTKKSSETKGLYVSALAGSFVKDQIQARYGGQVKEGLSYRVYGQHYNRGPMKTAAGTDTDNSWRTSQGGFRMDWSANEKNHFTLQGDLYGGESKTLNAPSDFNGQHLLALWEQRKSEKSGLSLQVYYDRYFKREARDRISDETSTLDVDYQQNYLAGRRHGLVWGLGYRRVIDHFVSRNPALAILPERKNLDLFTAFMQDEIKLTSRLSLSIGTKIINNVYSGWEWQPRARLSYQANKKNLLWTSVTRAVRTPNRSDVDYFSPVEPQPSNVFSIRGGPDFKAEKLVAYELGYRVQPSWKATLSLAGFYNVYRDLYSLEPTPGTSTFTAQNGSNADSWGFEFSGNFQVSDSWRLRGGYTYLDKNIQSTKFTPIAPDYQGNDARHQFLIQSMAGLPFNLQFDVVARFVDYLPATSATGFVPSYFSFDARLAYRYRIAELALVGQNLSEKNHIEFGTLSLPRGVYAKLSIRL